VTFNDLERRSLRYFAEFASSCDLLRTSNSSGDEIVNVNCLYVNIVHVLQSAVAITFLPATVYAFLLSVSSRGPIFEKKLRTNLGKT